MAKVGTKAVVIEFEGKRGTITQWAAHLGIRREAFEARLKRAKTFADAVRPPAKTLPTTIAHLPDIKIVGYK